MTPKTKIVTLVITGTAITALAGFAGWYIIRQYKMLSDYCYEFWKVKFNQISAKKIDMKTYFIILNKADADISISRQEFTLYVNGHMVSHIYSGNPVHIPAHGKSVYSVNIAFNPLQVLQISLANITDLLLHRENIKFDLEGYADAGTGGLIIKKIPFSYSFTLAELIETEDIPEAEVTC